MNTADTRTLQECFKASKIRWNTQCPERGAGLFFFQQSFDNPSNRHYHSEVLKLTLRKNHPVDLYGEMVRLCGNDFLPVSLRGLAYYHEELSKGKAEGDTTWRRSALTLQESTVTRRMWMFTLQKSILTGMELKARTIMPEDITVCIPVYSRQRV